jgi:cytochrome c biogenesis protein CcmG/thiol:disulfide interchange protein DsbE
MILSACSTAAVPANVDPLPVVSAAEFQQRLVESSQPIVVNVWASWCLPCRAEAPLLREAARHFEGQVTFIGVDVQDKPAEAAAFIAEFGLDEFDHVADPDRSIPALLGGSGVPITYFVASGGDVISMHIGIIDERSLVSGIDALLAIP